MMHISSRITLPGMVQTRGQRLCTKQFRGHANSGLFILLGHLEIALFQHPVVQPLAISRGHPLALDVPAQFNLCVLFDSRMGIKVYGIDR